MSDNDALAALAKLKRAAEFMLVGIAARNRRPPYADERMRDIAGPLVEELREATREAGDVLASRHGEK